MLRSVPDKLGGVICMGLAIVILIFLPYIDQPIITNVKFSYLANFFTLIFFANFILLG
jgi:quinol-cytochrome oxidoreductase complex cytochrome b subunit